MIINVRPAVNDKELQSLTNAVIDGAPRNGTQHL